MLNQILPFFFSTRYFSMVLGADTRHAIILGAQNGLTVRKIQTDLEKQGSVKFRYHGN